MRATERLVNECRGFQRVRPLVVDQVRYYLLRTDPDVRPGQFSEVHDLVYEVPSKVIPAKRAALARALSRVASGMFIDIANCR